VHYYVQISREYHLICFLIQPKKNLIKEKTKKTRTQVMQKKIKRRTVRFHFEKEGIVHGMLK